MKPIYDRFGALKGGIDAIRTQYKLPAAFPADAEAEARAAALRPLDGHADRTAMAFVTLDPTSATDLDQAFAIEASGAEMLRLIAQYCQWNISSHRANRFLTILGHWGYDGVKIFGRISKSLLVFKNLVMLKMREHYSGFG